jgi:hypothetical protein
MKRILGIGLAVLIAVAVSVAPAHAGLVTWITGGNLVMPAINYFGPGPQAGGPGYVWSSTNAGNQGGSVFGYTSGYGFGANGSWDGALGPMAGVNDAFFNYGVSDTMTFEFASPVRNVGGFINYFPDFTTPTTIAVWDAGHNLIESYNLTFFTGGGTNTGQFLGFAENAAIIKYFTLSDNYVGITDMRANGQVGVPDGGTTVTLLGSALLGLGMLRRKFRG